MARSTSPPPQLPSAANDALLEQLDDDIAKVRAEIAILTKRRNLLSASLLSSTKLQSYLASQTQHQSGITIVNQADGTATPADVSPLSALNQQHSRQNASNIHRLAFGVTSFPFTDPNPETSNEPLLGIRFDIPSHTGKFDKAPYYMFCKRETKAPSAQDNVDETSHDPAGTVATASSTTRTLSIHHHTIPAFVPLQDLINQYLPQPDPDIQPNSRPEPDITETNDEGYDSPASPANQNASSQTTSKRNQRQNDPTQTQQSKQDLHSLVKAVYTHLTSQSKRQSALTLLSEQMHPSLSSLEPTGVDCKLARLVWQNGMVGRIKIGDDGLIEKTVVFGDEGRMKDVERLLSQDDTGTHVDIMSLRQRLDEVARSKGLAMDRTEETSLGQSVAKNAMDVSEADAEFELE